MTTTIDVFTCEECGLDNPISYMSATRVDPGCYATDLECSDCGADLSDQEPEPWTLEELKWAMEGD